MDNQSLFTDRDLQQLSSVGISLEEATRQVLDIRSGFPYLHLEAPASLERGIVRLDSREEATYMNAWQDYLSSPHASVCKLVPASGAASRMFKSLFAYEATQGEEPSEAVRTFLDHLPRFAFYDRLNEVCLRNTWKSIPKLLNAEAYRTIIENLLHEAGLNYGSLPKGLLQFHAYGKTSRTAAEEHLVEGALYGRDRYGRVRIHFTVSPEHRSLFEKTLEHVRDLYQDRYGVFYEITFSEQSPATDTLALRPDGSLFRLEDESLLLRPGGHGALIRNLGALDADVVFIKNIDNVVPDHLKGTTVMYKKLLGGVLILLRRQIHDYLRLLLEGRPSRAQLQEMATFVRDNLCIDVPEEVEREDKALATWLTQRLDRPIRVCGMVRNQGEPGGGPFIVREHDGSTSLQILESTQINMQDEHHRSAFESGSYFNPVDIVCSLRNHKGERFDLAKYVNAKTAFIASKSLGGQELLALERPGLWNGGMHHWNTVFVEVPVETFNPVKEVNDLLRPEHQPS